MSDLLIPSFLMIYVSKSLRSLTKNERCEWITQVAHQKWATMSNSLRLLTNNEWPWANRSDCSQKMSKWANRSVFWANRSFAHVFAKNERFAQKTDERIPSSATSLSRFEAGATEYVYFLQCHIIHYTVLYCMYTVSVNRSHDRLGFLGEDSDYFWHSVGVLAGTSLAQCRRWQWLVWLALHCKIPAMICWFFIQQQQ